MSRAVVVGASLAGLMAARVLSKHFDRVTIIERDSLPESIGARRGAPQGRHVHALLIRGQQIMDSLFPGFIASLEERGATHVNNGTERRWHHFGCWKTCFRTDLTSISVSRPTLEHEMRRRVAQLPNVTIVNNAVLARYAVEWAEDWTSARITGVFVRTRGPEMPEELLRADLVIDASGRGSTTPRQLKELGYLPPPESTVKVNFGYASRIYEPPPGSRDWKAMYVIDRAPDTRGGLIFPIEGNRWMVTLFGWHGDHPSADEAGFLDFARSLPVRDLYDAIRGAQALTAPISHGFPASFRRHYERLTRFPAGLLVMGDALCSFNPVYGQGMTVSALEAELLEKCLSRLLSRGATGIEALTKDFRLRAAEVVELPWQLASAEDLRFPQTVGKRPVRLRFIHWYMAKLHEATGFSPLVAERFNAVMNMIAPRSGLFGWEVIRELLRGAFRTPTGPPHTTARSAALAPERRYG
jgi:2-polyprenyl-6-methoxyphenol hydroxylase-like FAD-dependent oxidoreductase